LETDGGIVFASGLSAGTAPRQQWQTLAPPGLIHSFRRENEAIGIIIFIPGHIPCYSIGDERDQTDENEEEEDGRSVNQPCSFALSPCETRWRANPRPRARPSPANSCRRSSLASTEWARKIRTMAAKSFTSDSSEELAGPRYALGEQFSKGGMGGLWYARESATGRTIALKRILGRPDPHSFRRFLNEARITARLEHPNIVPVHGLGTDSEDHPFYTMKLVQGTDLAIVLKKLSMNDQATMMVYPLSQLLIIFQKICDAVAFAHSLKVIHRDLKPANIMLGPFGEVLVMDWGLAKELERPRPATGEHRKQQRGSSQQSASAAMQTVVDQPGSADEDTPTLVRDTSPREADAMVFEDEPVADEINLTIAGKAYGSPPYMAPEQATGAVHLHGPRTDIYRLAPFFTKL
jgi:serine/threonine protein kinase